MNFFGIGIFEMFFVMLVALLVLGPSRMVEVSRTLGRYVRELQRATSEIPRLIDLDDLEGKPPTGKTTERQQIPSTAERQQETNPER